MQKGLFSDFRWCLLVSALALVVGCSSTGARLKAYEGAALPDEETATLKAPAAIKVIRVNDEKMSALLLKDMALQFSLKPGANDVVFQYRTIWAKNDVRRDGDSAVNIVESKPMIASFDAKAGETYTFEFEQAGDVREAQQIAEAFSAEIVNGARTVAIATSADTPAATADSQSAISGQSPRAMDTGDAAASVPDGLSTLEALNLLWKRASREEKEAFLQQAFD